MMGLNSTHSKMVCARRKSISAIFFKKKSQVLFIELIGPNIMTYVKSWTSPGRCAEATKLVKLKLWVIE